MLNDARMTFTTTQYEGQQVSKFETKNLEGSMGVSCENKTSYIITADSVLSSPCGIFQIK
jgi:hypothetical protein